MQKKCIIMLGQISGQICARDSCPEPCPDLLPQGFTAVGTNLRTLSSNDEWGGFVPHPCHLDDYSFKHASRQQDKSIHAAVLDGMLLESYYLCYTNNGIRGVIDMVSQAEVDKVFDLLVNYRKAIVDVTTAAPEDRLEAAYEFSAIDQMIHEVISGWVSETSDEGWIEWGGGQSPVEYDTPVSVRFRDGEISKCVHHARCYRWTHENQVDDVVAYRIVGPRTNTN